MCGFHYVKTLISYMSVFFQAFFFVGVKSNKEFYTYAVF